MDEDRRPSPRGSLRARWLRRLAVAALVVLAAVLLRSSWIERGTDPLPEGNTLAAALARHATRFVFTSSGAAFGRHDEPLRETLRSRALESPINYDRTKYLAECEVREGVEKGLDAVILNPAAVLGPRDPNFTTLFEQLVAGRLPAAMPASTSWCHVREVARAHLLAYEKGRGGENYLLGGPNAPQLEQSEYWPSNTVQQFYSCHDHSAI